MEKVTFGEPEPRTEYRQYRDNSNNPLPALFGAGLAAIAVMSGFVWLCSQAAKWLMPLCLVLAILLPTAQAQTPITKDRTVQIWINPDQFVAAGCELPMWVDVEIWYVVQHNTIPGPPWIETATHRCEVGKSTYPKHELTVWTDEHWYSFSPSHSLDAYDNAGDTFNCQRVSHLNTERSANSASGGSFIKPWTVTAY